MEVLLLIILAGFVLWLVAVADLIRATEMEQTARIILAAVLLLAPPVGVLLWLIVRQGRVGMFLATVLIVGTAATLMIIVSGATSHFGTQHVEIQSAGSGGAVRVFETPPIP